MISLIATLIILGIVFYFIEMIPMAAPFPAIIKGVAIILAIVIVLNFFGIHLLPLHV